MVFNSIVKSGTLQLSSLFTISLVGSQVPIPHDGGGGEGTTLNPNCGSRVSQSIAPHFSFHPGGH
jgi:hypothetical protein